LAGLKDSSGGSASRATGSKNNPPMKSCQPVNANTGSEVRRCFDK